jgi:hypothetical protein
MQSRAADWYIADLLRFFLNSIKVDTTVRKGDMRRSSGWRLRLRPDVSTQGRFHPDSVKRSRRRLQTYVDGGRLQQTDLKKIS